MADQKNSFDFNAIRPCNTSDEMRLIVDTLIVYNCRISEILGCSCKDVYNNKFVRLSGRKRSRDVIIRDRELVARYTALKSIRQDKLFLYTKYKRVYRYIQENYSSIINQVQRKKNYKVCHVFRYLDVNLLCDEEAQKTFLHHNSKKSNHFYLNKLKEG